MTRTDLAIGDFCCTHEGIGGSHVINVHLQGVLEMADVTSWCSGGSVKGSGTSFIYKSRISQSRRSACPCHLAPRSNWPSVNAEGKLAPCASVGGAGHASLAGSLFWFWFQMALCDASIPASVGEFHQRQRILLSFGTNCGRMTCIRVKTPSFAVLWSASLPSGPAISMPKWEQILDSFCGWLRPKILRLMADFCESMNRMLQL
jgi:hypothetical protein